MFQTPNSPVAVIGIDIGKNSFHIVGLDDSRCYSSTAAKTANRQLVKLFCNARPDHTVCST
jgi:hypothetical protein